MLRLLNEDDMVYVEDTTSDEDITWLRLQGFTFEQAWRIAVLRTFLYDFAEFQEAMLDDRRMRFVLYMREKGKFQE